MTRKKMGFDLADVCQCEDCEEPETTEVQDGQASPEGEPNAYDIAEIFLESVAALRALGAMKVAMFDCAVEFSEPYVPKAAAKTAPKKGAKT